MTNANKKIKSTHIYSLCADTSKFEIGMPNSPSTLGTNTLTRNLRIYQRSIEIAAPVATVFKFCASHQGFEKHFPHKIRNYQGPEVWELGSVFSLEYQYLGTWMHWAGEIVEMKTNKYFIDVMHKGIFARFVHRHDFEDLGGKTHYTDTLHFSLGFAGLVDSSIGQALLKRTFAKRQELLKLAIENPTQS